MKEEQNNILQYENYYLTEKRSKIIVVDDDLLYQKAAEHILTASGFVVKCFDSGEKLLQLQKSDVPDLILLDIHMPGINGIETMLRLKQLEWARTVPVVFLTADDDAETETKGLSVGAMDFIKKPFVPDVLLLRVRHTLELIRLQSDLRTEVRRMSEQVIKEHEKNERLSMQVVVTLAGAIDAKDKYTNGHSVRVAAYSREIAKRAGLSPGKQEEIYMMGLLHDVGKIGIPDTVINKPFRLTEEEYATIKTHPVIGYDILKNITELPQLAIGARWHHERYDGTGYPDGLTDEKIPAEARIIAVADAYDAMSSRRSYHEVFSQEYIINELKTGKNTQFDPTFAEIMVNMINEDKNYDMRVKDVIKNDTEE